MDKCGVKSMDLSNVPVMAGDERLKPSPSLMFNA